MRQFFTLIAIASVVLAIQLAVRYIRSYRLQRWMKRGMSHYHEKQHKDALRCFRKCVRLAPQWLYARTLMSMSLAESGDSEGARKEIALVEQLQPGEAETWMLIAFFHASVNNEDDHPLVNAVKKLVSLDVDAAVKLLDHPLLRNHHAAPLFQKLVSQNDQFADAE